MVQVTKAECLNAKDGAVSGNIIIAGDSHIRSFGVPLKSVDKSYYLTNLPHLGPNVFGLAGEWPRNFEKYWDEIQARANGNVVAVSWHGNYHLMNFLFAPSPLFDVVVSDGPDLPLNEAVDIVPEQVIRTSLSRYHGDFVRRVEALSLVAGELVVLGTPPPKEDNEFVRERLKNEPAFVDWAAKMGLDAEKAPLSLLISTEN